MRIAILAASALATLLGTASAMPAPPRSPQDDVRFGVRIGSEGVGIHFDVHNRRSVCPPPRPTWTPGRWEWCEERIWEPGRNERVWIEPVYTWHVDPCGRRVRVCVREGYWVDRPCEGRWVTKRVRKWIPGCWSDGHDGRNGGIRVFGEGHGDGRPGRRG